MRWTGLSLLQKKICVAVLLLAVYVAGTLTPSCSIKPFWFGFHDVYYPWYKVITIDDLMCGRINAPLFLVCFVPWAVCTLSVMGFYFASGERRAKILFCILLLLVTLFAVPHMWSLDIFFLFPGSHDVFKSFFFGMR